MAPSTTTDVAVAMGLTRTSAWAQLDANGNPPVADSGPGGKAPGLLVIHGQLNAAAPLNFPPAHTGPIPQAQAVEENHALADSYVLRYGWGFGLPWRPVPGQAGLQVTPEYNNMGDADELVPLRPGGKINPGDYGGIFDEAGLPLPHTVGEQEFCDLLQLWDFIAAMLGHDVNPPSPQVPLSVLEHVDYLASGAASWTTLAGWVAANTKGGVYVSPFDNADGTRTTFIVPQPASSPGSQEDNMHAAMTDATIFSVPNTAAQAKHPGWPNPSQFTVSFLRNDGSKAVPPRFLLNGIWWLNGQSGRISWTNMGGPDGATRYALGSWNPVAQSVEVVARLADLAGGGYELRVVGVGDADLSLVLLDLENPTAAPHSFELSGQENWILDLPA